MSSRLEPGTPIGTNQPAGRMTAVMRTLAAAPSAAAKGRIPRIAVLRGGRIVEEHLVRDHTDVTIGTSERARIVVTGVVDLPPSFTLLERVGSAHWLRFTAAMSGRLAGPEGVASLAELSARAHQTKEGTFRVPLTSDARGKVIVGDTTFLFQLVAPPPIATTPRLPLGVKNGAGLDWNLTIIAAFSFLLHFGMAGALYSDWLDPAIATDHVVAGIVDDVARLPRTTPERPLAPAPFAEAPIAASSPMTSSRASVPSRRSEAARSAPPASGGRPSQTSDEQAAALAKQAAQIEIGLLGARNTGPAVARALAASDIPAVDLGRAAATNAGVTHEPSNGLALGRGGPVTAGTSRLAGLAGDPRASARDNAGPEGDAPLPFVVGTPPPTMTLAITDADRVVASLRPRFRRCYEAGLGGDPTMAGKTSIVAKVAPNGEVQSASVAESEGLSPSVTACIAKVVGAAQFAGNGSVTTVRIPVSFVRQR